MERFIMIRTSWFPWSSLLWRNGQPRHPSSSRAGRRYSPLILEQLEDRTALSNFNALTVAGLIADIKAADQAGGTNTITLTAPTSNPYLLIAVDNSKDGPTGLPVITGGSKQVTLTIVGNGDTIERSTASGTPDFRLFDVASGASLTLQNLTLQNGVAFGCGSASEGGAIFNQGTLGLDHVTVQNNNATGSNGQNAKNTGRAATPGADGAGGGVWSSGTLTADNGTLIQNNLAVGGNGGNVSPSSIFGFGGNGGNASGGGVDIIGGTAHLAGATVSGNNASGGNGGFGPAFSGNDGVGGVGSGGGIDVAAGSLSLSNDTVQNNKAMGGGPGIAAPPDTNGVGDGGGIYAAGGMVTMSSNTVQSNTAGDVGGGLYVAGASLSLSNDTVNSNTAPWGGGLYVSANGPASTVTLTGVTVDSNKATGKNPTYSPLGGGLFVGGGTVTLSSCTVEFNAAAQAPGAIEGLEAVGGGLYMNGGTVNLSGSLVEYNSATGGPNGNAIAAGATGGGIAVWGGTVTFSGDVIENNTATGGNAIGAGLFVGNGTVTLCNDMVEFNTATGGIGGNGQGFGGGMYITPGSAPGFAVYIDSFTVANTINNTDGSGLNGPTANIDGTYILKNC
jgi:hypothetical protein